jgi:hypothetical protein
MRHTHPDAVTLVLSGYPALDEAWSAIRLQADESPRETDPKSLHSGKSSAKNSPTL